MNATRIRRLIYAAMPLVAALAVAAPRLHA